MGGSIIEKPMNRLIFDLLDIAAIIPSLALAAIAVMLAWYALSTLVQFFPYRKQLARQSQVIVSNGDFIDSDEYAFSLLGLPVFLASSVFLLWLVWALLLNLK